MHTRLSLTYYPAFQMISQNPKALACCQKEWNQLMNIQPMRSGMIAGTGGSSVLESRTTGSIWGPLSPTKESSAMEVSNKIWLKKKKAKKIWYLIMYLFIKFLYLFCPHNYPHGALYYLHYTNVSLGRVEVY